MSTEKKELRLPTELELTFKQNLKRYRKAAYKDGLMFCKTAKTFSEYLSINEATYTAYEAEKRSYVPDYDTLIAIATALGVSIDRLLGRSSPPDKIRFFLSDLQIDFRTKQTETATKMSSGSVLHRPQNEYFLAVPDSVRMYCDREYAFVENQIITNPWELQPRNLHFNEEEFEDIKENFDIFRQFRIKNLLFMQLLFLQLVQAYQDGYNNADMEKLTALIDFEEKSFMSETLIDRVFDNIASYCYVPDSTGAIKFDENKYKAALASAAATRKLMRAKKEQTAKVNDARKDFINKFRGGM